MCVSKMQSSQAPSRTTMRRTIKRSFLLCASLVITPPKHTNTIISTSSVTTVHTQLQHISHASTGKQHHSSHTCLIARLTLVLPLPPHATSPSFLLLFSKTIGTRRTTVLTDVEKAGMQMQMEGTQESKCFGKYASCNGMQRQEKMDLLTWGRSICEHS